MSKTKPVFFQVSEPAFTELEKSLKKIKEENPSLNLSKRQAFEIFLSRAFEANRETNRQAARR